MTDWKRTMVRRTIFSTFAIAEALLVTSVMAGSQDIDSADRTPINPTRIVFEHDLQGVTGFAIYVQSTHGEAMRIDLGALRADASGRVAAPLPPLPSGIYTLEIAAYNDSGESARVAGDPYRFQIDGSGVRAVPTVADGKAPTHEHAPAAAASAPPKPDKKTRGVFGRLWTVVVGDD